MSVEPPAGPPANLLARLRAAVPSQKHLLAYWPELDDAARSRLRGQIEAIDFDLIGRLYRGEEATVDWAALAERSESPSAFRLDGSGARFQRRQARAAGEAALRAGQIGMILVAGGQGTRLGFDHPKGMLPLGPVSGRTLFQILIDHLLAVRRRYDASIPLYVMTSPATHDETIAFLNEHRRFGLPAEDLTIFCQGVMPAVDARTGRLLLDARDSLCLSPDGHGGMLAALERGGCLQDARSRGVTQFFYGQIDNPLLQVCSAELIGYHLLADSELTTQVVQKRDPLERVGNVVSIDGRTQIIEYSDLPESAARRADDAGRLKLWAGNLAVHVFARQFLERIAGQADGLPFHRAKKKVACLDEQGLRTEPQAPNALKFERFIFDLLPAAHNAVVVEADPAEAFAPVKNADHEPNDTPTTARRAIVALHRRWLREAGATIDDQTPVEIDPLLALDAQELAERLPAGSRFDEPTYLR